MRAKTFFFLCLLLLCMIPRNVEGKEVVMIYFFHDNPCESCHEEEVFIDIVKQQILPLKEQYPYEFQIFSTMQTKGRETYLSMLEERAIDKTKVSCPLMIIGNQYVVGYEEIEEKIASLVKECRDDTLLNSEETASNSKETSSNQEEQTTNSEEMTSNQEELTSNSEAMTSNKSDDSSQKKDQVTENQSETAKNNLVEGVNPDNNQEKTRASYLLFTTFSCSQCEKVKKEIEKRAFPIIIEEVNILEENNADRLLEYFHSYGVPAQQQQVPILFYNGTFASGASEILSLFEKDAWWELGENQEEIEVLKNSLVKVTTTQETKGKWLELSRVIGTGVINGLNPCALSMFFLVLSILLGMNLGIIRNGLLYLGGKVVAYFVMGIGLFSMFKVAEEALFRLYGMFKWVLVIFAVCLALLNFLDFYHSLKGEYGKIRLQLPKAFRSWNQSKIRLLGQNSKQKVGVFLLFLGFLISLGEFFCTGQIYAATLLSLLNSTKEQAWIYFEIFSYVIALCIPSLLVLFVIGKSRNVLNASDCVLKRMPLIKLINGVTFLCFALFFFFM